MAGGQIGTTGRNAQLSVAAAFAFGSEVATIPPLRLEVQHAAGEKLREDSVLQIFPVQVRTSCCRFYLFV